MPSRTRSPFPFDPTHLPPPRLRGIFSSSEMYCLVDATPTIKLKQPL